MIQALLGVALVAGLLGFAIGNDYAVARCEAAKVEAITDAAAAAAKQATASNRVERDYVERVERVEVPVERVRRILVAGVCPAPADPRDVPVGDAGVAADGAGQSDADAELVAGIARDAEACIRNAEQLTALQALIRANTEGAPQQ